MGNKHAQMLQIITEGSHEMYNSKNVVMVDKIQFILLCQSEFIQIQTSTIRRLIVPKSTNKVEIG